jgi:hypothetical protein
MKGLKDGIGGLLVILVMVAGPVLGIAIAVNGHSDPGPGTEQQQRAQAPAPAPVPPPSPTPTAPPAPAPPAGSLEACNRLPTYAERDRCRIEEATRYGQRFRSLNPGLPPGQPWSPQVPSPRPIPPYPALPGDPNDRDHDGRACESGCIN